MRALSILFFVSLSIWKHDVLCAETLHCASKPDRFIGSTEASANFFSNARSAAGSLRYESKKYLGLIDQELLRAEAYAQKGEVSVSAARPLVARFWVRPRQYVREDPEISYCDKLAEQTVRSPFVYDPGPMDSMKKIRKWFTAFSQGENEEGNILYHDCPGRCSPQYTLYLYREAGQYRIQAQVLCGRPRDQYDNHYVLTVGLGGCAGVGKVFTDSFLPPPA